MLIPASGVKLADGFRSQREPLVIGTKSAGCAEWLGNSRTLYCFHEDTSYFYTRMCTSLKALFSGVCQTFLKNKWDVTRAKVV